MEFNANWFGYFCTQPHKTEPQYLFKNDCGSVSIIIRNKVKKIDIRYKLNWPFIILGLINNTNWMRDNQLV